MLGQHDNVEASLKENKSLSCVGFADHAMVGHGLYDLGRTEQ
jgi:hypothetical protein